MMKNTTTDGITGNGRNCPEKMEEHMNRLRVHDSIRGCLMAGAAGDALGYAVEFMRLPEILARFGANGITRFELAPKGKAQVSDDTQMTLFTANGLLVGLTRGYMRGIGGAPEKYVDGAYIDWYYTQTGRVDERTAHGSCCTWLRQLPELAHRRGPGITCLNACEALLQGKEVMNNSKGCGGIMRVAPMALLAAGYAARGARFYSAEGTDEAGAETARVTHRHPLGFLPAAALTHLLCKLVPMTAETACEELERLAVEAADALADIYKGRYESDKQYMAVLTRRAVSLARNEESDADNIRRLGEGWVAEETWTIALYCALRHRHHIADAIVAAVNHDGDSDSTGAVCGQIMGAIYGYEAVKRQRLFCMQGRAFEDTLELADLILAIADDLYTGCIISEYDPIDTPEKRQWYERYCEMSPAGIRKPTVYNRPFTSERIVELGANEVFVFGSNLAGAHGGGAARLAYNRFGAVWGQGVGMQGRCYAIPTMQGGVETIRPYVDEFVRFARCHRERVFLVTRIGCGIAGFSDEEIAPLFSEAIGVENIILPEEFVRIVARTDR